MDEEEFQEENTEEPNPIYENVKKVLEENWKPIVSIAGAIILITIILLLIPKIVTLKVTVVEADSQNMVPAKISVYVDGQLKESKDTSSDSYPLILNSVQAGKEIEFEILPGNGLSKATKYFTPTTDDIQNVQLVIYNNYNVNLEINPDKIIIGKGCTDQISATVTNNDPTQKQLEIYVPDTGLTDEFTLKDTQTRTIPITVPKDTQQPSLQYQVKIKHSQISSNLDITVANPGQLEIDTEDITCTGETVCNAKVKLTNSGESSLIIYPIQKSGTISSYITFDDPTVLQSNILLPPGTTKTLFITIPTQGQGKRGSIIITTSCTPEKDISVEFN